MSFISGRDTHILLHPSILTQVPNKHWTCGLRFSNEATPTQICRCHSQKLFIRKLKLRSKRSVLYMYVVYAVLQQLDNVCNFKNIMNLQGSKVVTLFNVKQEAFLSGYGSFVNDCLPDFLKSSNAGQSEKYMHQLQYTMEVLHL